ncbi:heterokaryon incompatibility protein-domain-containing protein [Nemania abortiva]|nr:heterokaryon incompatibility protein-domain-containing protein [Nemania abortiva]
MGLPPYPYRSHGAELPKSENEVAKPQKRRLARWLTPPFRDELPSFCQLCDDRKLDFRPLMEEPPEFRCNFRNCNGNCDVVEDTDLTDLEMKNAVYINDFSLQQAKVTKSECSLCRLLVGCANQTLQKDWLLYMSCVCILRPRYDRLGDKTKIIHRHQVWVEFQPIEGEIVFDMIYVNKFRSARKGRLVIPPTINLKLPKDWLQQCDQKHSHPAVPGALGSRMQAIINRGLFRAINTTTGSIETMTSIPKFIALSYVWGSAPEQSNYQSLESRPISAHAPTIRDAAIVAKSIGFKWLWVDRVCIDQTSRSEKAILIPYMKDIFAAAQLTIVAGCGDGAQSGLLGSPETPREGEKPIGLGSSVALLPVALPFSSVMDQSVWSRRGWTFEEFVFSRRLLFIFPSEAFFVCGTHTFRESAGRRPVIVNKGRVYRGIFGERSRSNTAELHRGIQRNPAKMSEVLEVETFIGALEEYTARNLTVEEDRVAAFAGVVIAALTNPMDEVSERALLRHGHPLRFFEILLTWQHFISERKTSTMLSKPFAPSWSWASSPMRANFHRVRNRLLLERDVFWFQYSFLRNHDVLGLPTEYNLTSHMIGLRLPDGLIMDQPWMKSVLDNLPPSHEARPSTSSSINDSLPLPKLHIITVVFDARFVHWTEPRRNPGEKHVLIPVGSTETGDDVYYKLPGNSLLTMEEWSIHPELQSRYSPDEISSRPLPFETFAIITGRGYYMERGGSQKPDELYYDLYIMLLDRTAQDNTYTRVGMTRLDAVKEGSYFVEVIKKGTPRWRHICII